MHTSRSRVAGLGVYLPETTRSTKQTDSDLRRHNPTLKLATGMIGRIAGVKSVHLRPHGWQTSDLAVAAARRALDDSPGPIDLLPFASASQDLIEPAIAEALPVTTPSPLILRSVVAPDSIGPVAVRAGDRVILATFAATRALGPFDPATNISATLGQLWFGAGSHFCLGAPLALAQIRLVVDALLDAVPRGDLHVVSRQPARGVLIPAYARVVIGR